MDEIIKLLGVDKLDESSTLEVKNKISEMVDVKARERAARYIKEERERLIKEYEEKFEEYKTDITSKFSNFVDNVLDEELKIPEKVIRYAKLGEMYHDLIEQFKIKLAIDEGVLDNDVRQLLKEARDEIIKLKSEVNKLTKEKMVLESDSKLMAAHIYLRKKCDGLSETKRNYILNLLGDITDVKEIDRKFDYALKMSEAVEDDNVEDIAEPMKYSCVCPKCGYEMESETECPLNECPNCSTMMEDKIEDVGKGSVEVPEEKNETVSESSNEPYAELKKKWLKILRENKF